MPLSFRQAGNLFVAGPNINIFPSGNTFAISGNAPSTTSSGFTGIINFGTEFFPIDNTQDLSVPNATMQFKSFSAGTGIGIIDSNNTLIFTASIPTVNGLTSFTSAGTGQYLLLSTQIANNNLIYKSLSGASNLSINDNNGTITFSLTGSTSGTIISGTNIGTGTGVFCGLTTTVSSNDTLAFYNLSGGPNLSLLLNDYGDIFVDRGSIVVTSFRNEGGGARILSAISSDFRTLSGRTLSGASGISALTASTVLSIRPINTTPSRFYINITSGLTTNANFGTDNITGSMGIGGAAVTTSRLLIAAGTANISQIRLQKSPNAVSSPLDGDIYYITTGNTLKFEKGTIETDFVFKNSNNFLTGTTPTKILMMTSGGNITTKNVVDFGIFNAISSLTISSTASETSIISSQLVSGNTKTLYATNDLSNPQLVVGKKFRFNAKGIISFLNFATTTFKVKLGSTIISSGVTNSSGFVEAVSDAYFEVDTTFTIRTTGATGTVIGSGKITTDQTLLDSVSPGRLFVALASTGEKTIDTTSNKIFDVTAQFDVSDASNSIIIYESTLEYLN